jgi:hypothetical protein
LVSRRRQDRSLQRAPGASSPIGRRQLPQKECSGGSNPPWRTNPVRVVQSGRDGGFKTRAMEVRILPRTPDSSIWSHFLTENRYPPGSSPRAGLVRKMLRAAVSQLAEEDGLNPFQCRIVACLRHQSRSLSSAAQSSGPTNRDRKFESSREHQYQASGISGQ